MDTFITLDPGANGAALLFVKRKPRLAFYLEKTSEGTTCPKSLYDWIQGYCLDVEAIFVEVPNPFRKQSIVSGSRQFTNIGIAIGVCELFDVPVERINPVDWTNWLKSLYPKGFLDKPKALSRYHAATECPEFAEKNIKPRAKYLHDGLADCLCLGLFLLERWNKENIKN